MEMRMRRMFVALLGILAVAAFAPQFASADSTGTITGTVTSAAAGVAIQGIEVDVTNLATGQFASVGTDVNGNYQITGLSAGSYQVAFTPRNDQGQDYVYQFYPGKSNAAAAQAVAVTSGQTTAHVDAALDTGATVSGEVTAGAGGAPVSGVTVYVRDYGGGFPNHVAVANATTDANGAWSVTGLPTGLYQVQFNPTFASNYATQYYNQAMDQDAPTPITLTAGSSTSGIDGALTMSGQITGTVTNGMTQAPAEGVNVVALDPAGNQYSYATTDAAGHYTLAHLDPSASYRVEFTPPSGSALEAKFYPSGTTVQAAAPVPVTLGQVTPNIDETLGQGGSISGVVRDAATGYPLGGETILLTDDAGRPVYSGLYSGTQPDGSYEISNLAPGSYKVQFASDGALAFQYYQAASTLGAATPVTVTAGQTATNIDGALLRGGTLEGVVTDASTGQGLPNGYLQVLDAGGHPVSYGYTDANGRYQIHGLAPGSYYLVAGVYLDGFYQQEFYGGTIGLAGATPVTITAGATSAGIDIAVNPESVTPPSVGGQSTGAPTTTTATTTTTSTTQTPVAVVTRVIPGLPTLLSGSVSGLGKGKPVVKFRLRSGSHRAHKLRSFRVKLPAGLAFVGAQLRKGVKVNGGGKVTEKVIGGQLVVTLGSPASMVSVSIGSPALKMTRGSGAHSLRVIVTVTPVNGTGHTLSFTVKHPA
jgi:hypothetical protein